MHITRYQPWGLFRGLQDDLDRLMESRLAMDDTSAATANWVPAVDIKEEKDRFVIRADVPGVKPEDIEITMENGILTIDGHRESEKTEEREDYRRTERVTGRFFRRFNLPDTADAESISARSEHGVLELSIPKHAKVMPRRINIDVN
jgi:HSP20 family protein